MQRFLFRRVAILIAGGVSVGCAAGRVDEAAGAPDAPAACIELEVQNLSLQGVTVWIEWDGSAPRSMGRLGLNARRVFRQRFRNSEVKLHFQRDGTTVRVASNAVLPTPGDRLDIVYRQTGVSPLRAAGVARC